jgi:hypothetical protein
VAVAAALEELLEAAHHGLASDGLGFGHGQNPFE